LDLTPLLIWWLITLIFGLVGWPLAFSLLRNLPDRGFAFARPVGLLLVGYILWLGGTFRLLQNNIGGILVALILVLAIGLLWRWQQAQAGDSPSMLTWLKQEWRYVLAVELLFHLAFVGWTIFKAHNPNIETAGGEKWMEIAFVNSTLRSDYFPPPDPWLSGFAISYYYFGYVLMAMLTRLSGLVSTVAYNLYIPTLFAMTLTAAFGVVANMVSLHQTSTGQADSLSYNINSSEIQNLKSPALLTGFVGALFVVILGNLEGLLEVLHKRGLLPANFWLWLDIRNLKEPPPGSGSNWIPDGFAWWQGGFSPADIEANLQAWIPDRFIWWWRGSRVLTDYTLTGHEQEVIDEFPFFSFLLGDVHPHVLALPFVLLVVALALNLLVSKPRPSTVNGQQSSASESNQASSNPAIIDKLKEILQSSWRELTEAAGGRLAFVLYAVYLGGLSFLNTWDFPIYLSVVGLVFIIWLAQRRASLQNALQPGIIGTALLGLAGLILYLPFHATFQSQAKGILPNLWNPTRLPQFFVFFGPFLVAITVLLIVLSSKHREWSKHLGWSLPLTILGPVLVMLIALSTVLISPAGRNYVEGIINNPEVQQVIGAATVGALVQASLLRRITNPWTFLLVGGLMGWILALLVGELASQRVSEQRDQDTSELKIETHKLNPPTPTKARHSPSLIPNPSMIEKFVLILLLIGLGLTLAVEFIYLRDNFGIRMNTIFKFYFQAWVLLALAAAFAVYYVSKNLRVSKNLMVSKNLRVSRNLEGILAVVWQVSMTLLVIGGMVYPVLATLNKANNFQNKPTLNGIQWIAEYHPDDYAAIEWLRANAPAGAIILEASGGGEAYSYTNRISALTGLPTLLGWGNHEGQWRGNYDEPGRREPEIERLFNTTDLQEAQMLLGKYDVTYVYVGSLERNRYSPQGLKKFEFMMDVAFQQDGVTIYERR
jgi:YYY domain-containing protein